MTPRRNDDAVLSNHDGAVDAPELADGFLESRIRLNVWVSF
jgi:hypothetical protein